MITEPTTVGVGRARGGFKFVAALAAVLATGALAVALIGPEPIDSPSDRAGAAAVADRALLHDYGLRHDVLPRSAPIVESSVDYRMHDYGLRHPPQPDPQVLRESLATSHDFALREMARQMTG
jgi:hypothetical protein